MKKFLSFITLVAILVCLFPTTTKAATVTQNITVKRYYDKAFKVVELVNAERAKYGLNPLSIDMDLYDSAMLRATEAIVLWSHDRPDGTECYTASPKMYGENLAQGYNMLSTPESAVTGWMNSPGHRANILTPDFTTIGVGAVSWGNYYFWSQNFGYGSGADGARPSNDTHTYTINVNETYVKNNGGYLNRADKTPVIAPPTPPVIAPVVDTAKEEKLKKDLALAQSYLDKGYAIRLFNRTNGSHYMYVDIKEIEKLLRIGLEYETDDNNSFMASKTRTDVFDMPIFRLSTKNGGGDVLYAATEKERDYLMKKGWAWDKGNYNSEGAIFYVSSNPNGKRVYRLVNYRLKAHHFATQREYDYLMKLNIGWEDETAKDPTNSWFTP